MHEKIKLFLEKLEALKKDAQDLTELWAEINDNSDGSIPDDQACNIGIENYPFINDFGQVVIDINNWSNTQNNIYGKDF